MAPFCLRCNTEMCHIITTKLQLGEMSWLLGELPNLIAGALPVDIYICPSCGKLEFFQTEEQSSGIAQINCPRCGRPHDCDYPKCPHCKYDYNKARG